MAECHPVGFQWVTEAKERGATVIHVDPRFTRTSALADVHVPLRAGTDIAFLGGLINYVLENELDFREYVVNYTNAPAIVREDFRDTEDLDGLFSGYDPRTGKYDHSTWAYEGVPFSAAAGEPAMGVERRHGQAGEPTGHPPASGAERFGGWGAEATVEPNLDPTLQHPRCVYQILKRHFSRYTPELVEQICGVQQHQFLRVAKAITENSGRDRTTAFCYAVGWTQHTVGVQYIRTAAILQLLLGNIGRPGGGILALRGHASIQGSTDIPTLYNLLPGYIPMPRVNPQAGGRRETLEEYTGAFTNRAGFWGNMRAYLVSLLKAYWGDHAQPDNDFCFDYLPLLSGDHGHYRTVLEQLAGRCRGYFLVGENPAVGSANGRLQRFGLANLDWLVVRDFRLIESATFWYSGPEIESGEMSTDRIGTEVFFLPAASHVEKEGTFTNTQRLLQWREKALDPPRDARSELWFYYHLGNRIRRKLADSTDPADLPIQHLAWDYPVTGRHRDPDAEAVLAEINGYGADGGPLSSFGQLSDDGSTSCGCWIYCGVYADGRNQAANRVPGDQQSWVAPDWGWAWPANRRILYNRASADPDGKPWSARKRYVYWDPDAERWTGPDVPDFEAGKPPDYRPSEGARAQDALSGTDPFVMQSAGRAWLYVPSGLSDGPLPTHYEPAESPIANPLYGQSPSPARITYPDRRNRLNPSAGSLNEADRVFPYVFTTYRLTEHHTAGGMSRTLPYLAALQPAFFCEVSPELAAERGLEHGGWATLVTARAAVEARVMVTRRLRPLRIGDRTVHQIGLPYHWGSSGLSVGDGANDLLAAVLDPNVLIQAAKAATCDIRPGRRPRGPELPRLVADYQRRAGITDDTGIEHSNVARVTAEPDEPGTPGEGDQSSVRDRSGE